MSETREQPFNPLDKRNLADNVVRALLATPVRALPPPRFSGVGVYALYYVGGFSPYAPLVMRNIDGQWGQPIYVGSALPEGGRTGGFSLATPSTRRLYDRLRQHANSIRRVTNLELADFWCRYLIVDDIWIPLGESWLIESLRPLWNVLISGFGIHAPGGNRPQMRSAWDELHPGRPFAENRLPHQFSAEQLAERAGLFFRSPEFAERVTEEALHAEDDGSVV